MTLAAHFTAFKTRLAAHALLSGKVDSALRVTAGNEPVRANYLIAYPAAPADLDDQRYAARQSAASRGAYEFDVRVIAVDPDGLTLLADAAIAQLVGHSLNVTGRTCDPISLDTPGEKARFDRAANLHYLDLLFTFTSRRAT